MLDLIESKSQFYSDTSILHTYASSDLMDRECNYSFLSKVNGKCVYEGKCQKKYLIYEVKCSMCEAIYIGNTQQTFKKRMDVISPISYVVSKTDKNQTHLLPISNITLILLRHVLRYI